MATINVSRNYPRYQSRTSTGGVSCKKWQFLYFYGHHQKQFLCTFWWRNHGLGRNNSTWQDGSGDRWRQLKFPSLYRRDIATSGCSLRPEHGARGIVPGWPHRARIVDAYLQQEQITRVDWPACSPDLNPIEHAWDQLGRAVQTRLNMDSTRADLRRFLLEEWDMLPQNIIQHLIHIMRRRCAEWLLPVVVPRPTHYWCTVAIKLMCSQYECFNQSNSMIRKCNFWDHTPPPPVLRFL